MGGYRLASGAKGEYAAVVLKEERGKHAPADHDPLNPRYRVGRIHLPTGELSWVGQLTGRGIATVRQLAVSDDGKYVAVGGWENGVALIDASQSKVLWSGRPPTEVSTGYVVFSADGLTLYSAGSEGCVYTIDTLTGKITSQWWASPLGRSIYGYRVSCLTVSGDGQWVAAGTGPEGHVYLFNTASPGKPRMLPHGLNTILAVSFSPDSQYLASVGGGSIKVWSVKEAGGAPGKPEKAGGASQWL
jgi:WD40 repeat protein